MVLRRLPALASQAWPVIGLAALTGVLVGLVVAAFEQLTQAALLDHLLEQPVGVQAAGPVVGLALTALALRYLAGRASPRTSDDYIRAYHERHTRLPLSKLPGKLVAGVTTIGLGGAMGLEGPAVYAGATVGSTIQERAHRFFRREDAKVLLAAGAAAGVAAVFKTPATGVVFALEVPYKNDVARRALLPALIAAATSYLTYVAIVGTEPVIPVLGSRPSLEITGLGGAVLLGVLAGLGGRLFAGAVHWAKRLGARISLPVRIGVAGGTLAGLALASHQLFDEGLTLGPGYEAISWASDPERDLTLVAILLGMRVLATIATVGGGGAGGLFIPLAVQGVVLGRLVGGWLDRPESGLYPVIGLAAFLGAGYRAPIAAVMFVAETSRGDVYVIPALIAAAVSQLVAGSSSVSDFQRDTRQGHLERRFTLPITSALTTDVLTVPPDATASEFVFVHVIGQRERSVPVVDAGRYRGMCGLDEVSRIERSQWDATTIDACMRTDLPVARPSWSLRDAVAAMEASSIDAIAVTDADGTFIGIVSEAEIVKLDEILDETEG